MHCAWQMYWHSNDAVSDLMANRRIECKYTFMFSTDIALPDEKKKIYLGVLRSHAK